jgi:hypothetical protein
MVRTAYTDRNVWWVLAAVAAGLIAWVVAFFPFGGWLTR